MATDILALFTDLVKSMCVALQQSGLFLNDVTYFSKKMRGLPFGKVYVVYLSMFLCRFQDADYWYGIPPLPSFHY